METISEYQLLPRPDHSKTYRQPLEAFVNDSIVIIVGNKQGRQNRRNVDLYKNCSIFTALTEKPGTKKQKEVFDNRPMLDHLWISNKCSRWNEALGIPDIFAIGKINWYTRKDGIKDLALFPTDVNTHIECLFVGVVFIYGLHIIEESQNLKQKGIITKNYKYWEDQLKWLKDIAHNFKETVIKLKIKLGETCMLKYVDKFLTEVEKQIKKGRNHVDKMQLKKGFAKQDFIYI
jgi:hypothetical protein